MDLERLETLIALAEHGSVAAVARALDNSRSTVKKRIQALEAEVGVALVMRAGRGLGLTAAGQVLVRGGRGLLVRGHELIDRVRTNATGVVGEYRVAVPLGMPPWLSVQLIAGHRARFPGIRLHILPVPRPFELLPRGADIAVTFGPRPAEGPWISALIRRVPEMVLATRSYLDRHGTPHTVEDLAAHTLLSWVPPGEDAGEWPLEEGGFVTVRPAIVSPDIVLVRQCMLANMGLARVPDGGLPEPEVPAGHVVRVLPDVLGRELTIRAILPDSPKTRGPYRQYIESIREVGRER